MGRPSMLTAFAVIALSVGCAPARRASGVPAPAPEAVPGSATEIQSVGITPVVLSQPKPDYPDEAFASGAKGVVSVEFVVDGNGNVAEAKITKSDPLFDEAALSAVRKWRYEPVVFEGRAIYWKSRANFTFERPPLPDLRKLGIDPPVATYQPQPRYPIEARRADITGEVALEIIVDVRGVVIEAKITKSHPTFDEPALFAVRQWRYEPLILDGRATAWTSVVNLKFQLR